jgi:hypothetical protein
LVTEDATRLPSLLKSIDAVEASHWSGGCRR